MAEVAVDGVGSPTRLPREEPRRRPADAPVGEVGDGGQRAGWPVAGAVLVCAASLALVLIGLVSVASASGAGDSAVYRYWHEAAASAVAFAAVGGLIAARRPGHLVGWLFLGLALLTSVQLVSGQLATAAADGLAPVSVLAQALAVGGFVLLVLLFPTGTVPSRSWHPALWLVGAAFGLAALAQAVGPTHLEDFGGRPNPLHLPVVQSVRSAGPAALGILCGAAAAVAVAALVFRLRTAGPPERAQLKWFVWVIVSTAVVLLVGDALVPGVGDYAWALGPVAVAAAAAVAVLRYDLYDIDVVLRRSYVLVALTLLVVTGYVAVVQLVAAVLPGSADGRTPSLLATAAVAVAFTPVRERVQRLVDRRLFGERDDPYGALTSLAERLHAAPTPQDVLEVAVTTVARAVRSPFVAVEVGVTGQDQIAASCGEQRAAALRLPLVYKSETVGHLAVAARAGERGFARQDVRLLTELARQVGLAAHTVALSAALQRSRERLVTTREEERRRLRRDLHDGLGPTLTGVTLLADAARSQILTDPAGADSRLRELRAETKGAIESIRRLVYDLRPPALDELGLVEAVREHTRSIGTVDDDDPLRLSVVSDDLPPLSAAVEVAVYRIVGEAVTNVVRHARARRCEVRLAVGDRLVVTVADDGVGVLPGARAGVGLASMRERASELGGSLAVRPAPDGGTLVTAVLPVTSL